MSDAPAVTPQEPAQPALSFPARFWGVIISPGETFADVVRAPGYIAPLVVSVLAAVAVTETMLAKIGMERIVRAGIAQSGRASSMSPEQLDQAVRQGVAIGGVIAHIAGFVGAPLFLLIISAIGLLALNALFGQRAKFQTVFSVACYAYLPAVIGGLMAVAMILFGDPERFNAQNPVPANVGFFLNPVETSKPLYVIASSFDLFTLWVLILVGVGLSEATGRKVSARSIFLVYTGLWVIWVLGKLGWTMVIG